VKVPTEGDPSSVWYQTYESMEFYISTEKKVLGFGCQSG